MKQKRENICMILAICFVGVLLGELYLFKTCQDSIYIIVAGMAVLLILTYLLSSNLIALHKEWMETKSVKQEELLNRLIAELTNHKEDRTQEALENVEKFEKAIYVAMQQHTTKMLDSLEQLNRNISGDFDRFHGIMEENRTSIIEQLEATKEHSAKVYVKFSRENTKSLMMFQKKAFDNVMLGMEETIQEYTKTGEKTQEKLEELKLALAHETLQAPFTPDSTTTVVEDETIPEVPMENSVPEETVMIEEETPEEIATFMTASPDTLAEDNTDISEPSPVNDDPSHVMTPEEIAAFVASSSDTLAEDNTDISEPSPVNDDPSHVMTPEEIAAFVASSSDTLAEDNTDISEPSPVNDDPSHVMTPEEIAALIAGTQ